MNTEIHSISIQKTGRIVVHGQIEKSKILLIALHGYGQLVPYFIRKFQHLDSGEILVIAPEGLHRFYLNGSSGRVGASWMTKEARIDDINDNISYLNQVYKQFVGQQNFEKIIILGFSQGAATAARWIEKTEFQIDAFIQWAGVFPPDLEINASNSKWQSLKHFYVVGNQDPYFAENSNDEYNQSAWLNKHNFYPETITFDGKHDIDATTLNQILEKVG
jgi:dienelactone hydrolase